MEGRGHRFQETGGDDPRSAFQRDRDRVLYSPEFRRLSGVTQVASSGEGDVFHNRLTHSLKVAQVGRRLAERLLKSQPELIRAWGGLDPDVVETAGLAHDLGHPPFGHDDEDVICRAVEEEDLDGFEGNAQSFRIVTRLAAHTDNARDVDDGQDPGDNLGLNLTRATLNAILKYPWLRGESEKRRKKWGAYRADEARFLWVKGDQPDGRRALEAELMDWADDVTYAVHDLEDFYRAGLIPIHLLSHKAERERFISAATERNSRLAEAGDLVQALASVLGTMALLDGPYDGGRKQRTLIDAATSALITQFITGNAIQICDPSQDSSITIDPDIRLQVTLLQEVTYYYVIGHPRIASIREGQREMLAKLFDFYIDVINGTRNQALLPEPTRDRLQSGDNASRLAADLLAGMTERQVTQTYQRLTGILPGPISYFDL